MSSVSAHVAHALTPHATDAFGVMGHGNAHFLDSLHTGGRVRFTAVRHEAAAVAAADAYFRACDRLAVATTTYGAGFTNTITALAEAAQARVPLVLVTGDRPTPGPRPWDVDQAAIAAAVGVRTFVVGPDDAATVTTAALHHALSARVPVVVAIPYDLAAREAGVPATPLALEPPPRPRPDATAVAAAAADLAAARRPFLLAGRGAVLSGAGAALGGLADAVGAVTGTTAIARSLFPDARYDVGVTGGFGHEEAMALVGEADVVLVVGAGLNQFTSRFGRLFGPGTKVVQVDESEAPTHPAVSHFVRGDAAQAVHALCAALPARRNADPAWRAAAAELTRRGLHRRDPGVRVAPDGRLDPRSVATRLAEILPQDRVVVSDGGHFIGWANAYWPVAGPHRMQMVGTAYQTIGLGLASAVGAAKARPDSTIVLSTGDGGCLMALADLESVVRETRRGVVVVWNDAAYNAEVSLYGRQGLAIAPMLIPEVDFAALARAVGAEAAVARTLEDLDALADWVAAGREGVFLLDCRVSATVVAPHQEEIVAVHAAAR
ncbi:thiamine pyrophosphate-dependent acetolactate synthase large subunit-like protein [Kineococcus xinjiangensis]|uniref:Thiamine pyrophosphate-dependent acetolactate synthase large subunit-like protein n=1 Tax=Kineococcus xinjiangensis TaxID=512762 RepID=A0A2S6IK70_9ACTN|nr:thiamine pyrophosphate-binding protein [Kineococcus xinjiangensis]PPK94575.1 thiamine pyrophosphate-dependent acetolactate synthase large subunit-like protein [Kineococcus xinjiangensis]